MILETAFSVTLELAAQARQELERRAAAAYPEECCGLLIGPMPDDFGRPGALLQARELVALSNAWAAESRTHRYTADPREFASAERQAAARGAAVLGIYHSHPDVPAWPSPFDLLRAWPNYAYVIVSVERGRPAELRVWRLSADGRSFQEGEVR